MFHWRYKLHPWKMNGWKMHLKITVGLKRKIIFQPSKPSFVGFKILIFRGVIEPWKYIGTSLKNWRNPIHHQRWQHLAIFRGPILSMVTVGAYGGPREGILVFQGALRPQEFGKFGSVGRLISHHCLPHSMEFHVIFHRNIHHSKILFHEKYLA